MKHYPGQSSLLVYFILAYLLSWCSYVPLALQSLGLVSGIPGWLHLLGAYGPLLAAFITAGYYGGSGAIGELWSRITRWRIGWKWFMVALFSVPVVYLFALAIQWLISGIWPSMSQLGQVAELPGVSGLAGWVFWILSFGLGEETGWRGYALPRLQKRYDARKSSLILGLLWAFWHAPVFFYNYQLALFNVLAFLVGILAGSAFLTSLFNSTGGSVLAVALWHGTYNAAVSSAPGIVPAVVTAFVIIAVILVSKRFGAESFSANPKQTSEYP